MRRRTAFTYHPKRAEPTARRGSLLRVLQDAVYRDSARGDHVGRVNRKLCETAIREHAALIEQVDAHPGLSDFVATCHAPWPALWHHTERTITEALSRKAAP